MPTTPGPAVLIDELSVKPFGGDAVHLADINGDGKSELLILQSAGQFCSDLCRDRGDLDDVDRQLHCLTAVTLDGEVLWQDGVPYDRDVPFTSHGVQGGNMMLAADDIDGDGKVEVLVIRHGELVVLDGPTGCQRDSVKLPSDNFVQLVTAQLGPPEQGRQVLCKVNDAAYPPWRYANPTVAYDADLSVYREPFAVPGSGHNMVVMDVDGDGRDEVVIGYSLLGQRLAPIWSLDLGPGFDYTADHADQVRVCDCNGDGQLEVLYAGSEDFFVCDLKGKVLWKSAAGHSQASIAGPWGPAGEMRILMAEKNRGLWGLDSSGLSLWHRTDLNGYAIAEVRWARGPGRTSWALFRPQLRPIRPAPYESDPVWSRELWPRFMDGDGSLIDVLPWREDYAQPRRWIRAERSYDCGVKYYPIAADLDGDGLDEILVYDRDRVWLFHSPES